MAEPGADDPDEALAVQPVIAAAPLAPHRHQPSLLQDPEVSGGGGPAVPETRRQVARGQLAAEMAED